jgi:succinoglycan biosynthesis protein ExoM
MTLSIPMLLEHRAAGLRPARALRSVLGAALRGWRVPRALAARSRPGAATGERVYVGPAGAPAGGAAAPDRPASAPSPATPPGAPAPRVAAARVAVCISTYARPVMLRRLLESLGRLAFAPGAAPALFVVVVDNDARRSAEPVVEAVRPALPCELVYLVEPVRNISLARNRGVREALKRQADFVAFVDDDEVVSPGWLAALLEVRERYGADAVSGSVLPVYPRGAPGWVVEGDFFATPRPRTGAPMEFPQMCNVLVSARLLRGRPGPFDPAFGLTGGGDSLFFTRCHREGARIVAADEARVDAWVPESRGGARWILQRAFRVGNAALRVERALDPPHRRVGHRAVRGAVRLGLGAATLLPAALLGRRRAMGALWSLFYGMGCCAALAGYEYVEYRRVHGE